MPERFIGIMSGTSLDAVDVVIASFQDGINIEASLALDFPDSLRDSVRQLCLPGQNEIDRMGEVSYQLADIYARAVNKLLTQSSCPASDIRAIGLHGQTIRHRPEGAYPFSLQIGSPARVAELTGIPVIADFRSADIAAGGQGAPLVPAFHTSVFRSASCNRIILNLGGMANLTILPADATNAVRGYDTGPGNILLDEWIRDRQGISCDKNGAWAAQGNILDDLLALCLQDPFFALPPPKSTGREYFTLQWINNIISQLSQTPAGIDVQATLSELTAQSVTDMINQEELSIDEVFVCGGGVHNNFLLQALTNNLGGISVQSTAVLGLDPDYVEAACFAWLAQEHTHNRPANLPSVTGAAHPVILGAYYPAG